MSRRQPRWSYIVAALVAAPLLTACGGGGDDPPADGAAAAEESSTTAEQPTTTLDTYGEVRAAFLAFNSMTDRLRESPNPDDPEIAQRASGETLAGLTDAQTTLQTTGFSARFGARDSVEILSVNLIDASTAVLRDCQVEDLTEVDPSGQTNGPFVRTFWTEYTLIKVGEAWMVDSSDGIERREGEHPCE